MNKMNYYWGTTDGVLNIAHSIKPSNKHPFDVDPNEYGFVGIYDSLLVRRHNDKYIYHIKCSKLYCMSPSRRNVGVSYSNGKIHIWVDGDRIR